VADRVITSSSAAVTAGELVAEGIRVAIRDRERARFAITGGSAAEAVAHTTRALGPSWAQVLLTWIDERCVAFDDPQSNRGEAHRRGYLPGSPEPLQELPLWRDDDSPASAVRRVDSMLRDRFSGALDVVLLGLGDDGHIASLFPGHPAATAGGLVVHVEDSPKPPPRRMSLTLSLLGTAACCVLLACGEGKRQALTDLVQRRGSSPALRLPRLRIVTDLTLEAGDG
jgi:6-phosphogluconolactonase